ncbi:hypothetical protein CYMTET_32286 [Cymbomonas tetramitiformis]|uniref:EF-hand domain-containing protein n=1 Tax=Cymbomonas tetramitiformis TaxID=36881 RepID=A0AAE0FFX8_9CHLO|nr:hypothetical protein CYMTET_32286 [Cymbomonas tetramitiformis]
MIVMLGFSGQITTIIARNMLGSKSVLYKSVISERLDALSIYGRFASQAITASLCYDIFDGNGSGRLSKPEIYEQLSKLFHRSMSKTQMATLVEFVMYMAEITHIPKLARGQSEEEEEEEMDLDNNSEDEEDAAELLQQETSAGRKMSILPVQKRTRNGTKSHVTRNQWVSVFTGPPCSLQQCINVIDRKSEQGHFVPKEEDMASYEVMEVALKQSRRARRKSSIFRVPMPKDKSMTLSSFHDDSTPLNSQVLVELQETRKEIRALRSKISLLENHVQNQNIEKHKDDRIHVNGNLPTPPSTSIWGSISLSTHAKNMFDDLPISPAFNKDANYSCDEEDGGLASNRAMHDEQVGF